MLYSNGSIPQFVVNRGAFAEDGICWTESIFQNSLISNAVLKNNSNWGRISVLSNPIDHYVLVIG